MNNVVQFEDLKKAREKANIIASLKHSIKEYQQILTVKKNYLKSLRKFDKYSKIEAECTKIYTQILDYEAEIRKLKFEIEKLSQG